MDPTLLRTFVTVARSGSFSAAADELGYTQSAVSQQIAALERDVGAAVLSRRPVAPTPIGARLLDHARHLLLRIDAARADIARMQGAHAGRLAVGATPLSVTPRLGEALAAARRAHPSAATSVRLVDRVDLIEAVAVGRLDLGLTDGAVAPSDPLALDDHGTLRTTPITEEPLTVVLPAAHPLARAAALRLPDLADARWLDAPAATVPLDQLRAATGTGGYRPFAACDGADVASVLELVATGHGLVVLPRRRVPASDRVVAIPITEPRLVHRIELVCGHAPDGAAATMIDALTSDAAGPLSPRPG